MLEGVDERGIGSELAQPDKSADRSRDQHPAPAVI
jgi:hypothetical protein